MAKEIPLTKGKVAIVDDEDYRRLVSHKWSASGNRTLYAAARANGKTIYMHRVVIGAVTGQMVDHINGDPFDNRKANLRLCTTSQNLANSKKYERKCTSAFKGVGFYKRYQKWRSSIGVRGAQVFLGYFDTEEAAARAYNEAALRYHGEFARLNNLEGVQ